MFIQIFLPSSILLSVKKGILGLAVLLSLSLIPAYAATPPKPGSICAKQGFTQIYKSKSYTCIKSGKKLVWNKGVEVKSKTATDNQLPSSPSANDDNYAQRAVRSVDAQLKNSNSTNLKINLVVANDSNKYFVELGPKTIMQSGSFWNNFYSPNKSIPVLIAPTTSFDWLREQLATYSYSLPQWRYDQLKNMKDQDMQLDVDVNPSTDSVIYFVVGKDVPWLNPTLVKTMISHEYVHTVQVGILKVRDGLIPCWSTEGSAVFYGNAITATESKEFETEFLKLRNNWLNNLNFKNSILGKSEKELLSLLEKSESDFKVCAAPLRLGYSAGSLMTEILVAKYGHQKFVQWWIQSKEKEWKKAFEDVFGIKVDEFYLKIAVPYLLETAKVI